MFTEVNNFSVKVLCLVTTGQLYCFSYHNMNRRPIKFVTFSENCVPSFISLEPINTAVASYTSREAVNVSCYVFC